MTQMRATFFARSMCDGTMQAEIEAYMQAPEKWVREHLLDAN